MSKYQFLKKVHGVSSRLSSTQNGRWSLVQAVSKYTQLLISCVVVTLHLLVFKFSQPRDVRLCHWVSGSLCYLVHINPGFLNNCYICLPLASYWQSSAKTGLLWCSLNWKSLYLQENLRTNVLDCCYMLNIPRFAGNTSSLGWFARLASPLLSKTRHVLQ